MLMVQIRILQAFQPVNPMLHACTEWRDRALTRRIKVRSDLARAGVKMWIKRLKVD